MINLLCTTNMLSAIKSNNNKRHEETVWERKQLQTIKVLAMNGVGNYTDKTLCFGELFSDFSKKCPPIR